MATESAAAHSEALTCGLLSESVIQSPKTACTTPTRASEVMIEFAGERPSPNVSVALDFAFPYSQFEQWRLRSHVKGRFVE